MSCQDLVLGDDDGVLFLPSRRPRRSVATRLTMIVNCCRPVEPAARARAIDQPAPPLMPAAPDPNLIDSHRRPHDRSRPLAEPPASVTAMTEPYRHGDA
jgi:hypothetical protein